VLGIFRKDLFQYALLTVLMLPWPLLLFHEDGLDRGIVMMFGYVTVLSVITALVQNEAAESMSGGYRFLSALPLSSRDIVAAKHLLLALFTVAQTLWAAAAVRWLAGSGVFFSLSLAYLVLNGAGCLLLGAGLLWVVNRYRLPALTRLVSGAVTLIVGLLLLGEFLLFARRTRGGFFPGDLARYASWVTPLSIAAVALAAAGLFWLLMRASVAAHERKEF
jgi:hypothetical protein